MRWTWRVGYYSYSALGTDAYPPFSLGDEPDYPARLSVVCPQQLSRGLVLVKWWLLALPHYLIVGVFTGGAFAGYNEANNRNWWYGSGPAGHAPRPDPIRSRRAEADDDLASGCPSSR